MFDTEYHKDDSGLKMVITRFVLEAGAIHSMMSVETERMNPDLLLIAKNTLALLRKCAVLEAYCTFNGSTIFAGLGMPCYYFPPKGRVSREEEELWKANLPEVIRSFRKWHFYLQYNRTSRCYSVHPNEAIAFDAGLYGGIAGSWINSNSKSEPGTSENAERDHFDRFIRVHDDIMAARPALVSDTNEGEFDEFSNHFAAAMLMTEPT